jgi:type I restriction enzyme S subunit
VPEPGDLIVVREGGGTGRAGLVREGQRFSLGQRVMQLRPDRVRILPAFLLYQWLDPAIQDDLIGSMSQGSASPHLNVGIVKRMPITVPPLDIQSRTVERCASLHARTGKIAELSSEAEREMEAGRLSLSRRILDAPLPVA